MMTVKRTTVGLCTFGYSDACPPPPHCPLPHCPPPPPTHTHVPHKQVTQRTWHWTPVALRSDQPAFLEPAPAPLAPTVSFLQRHALCLALLRLLVSGPQCCPTVARIGGRLGCRLGIRGRPAVREKGTYGGRPGQRVEEQGTWAAQKHSEAGYGRPVDRSVWTAKTVKPPQQQPAHPQYANYWALLTRKRHTMSHSAQPQHTNHWAPRTRKRHQQEHRP